MSDDWVVDQLFALYSQIGPDPSWEERFSADGFTVSIDYHATGVLLRSLVAAGVKPSIADTSALPLKTRMRIANDGAVSVWHGYRADEVVVWKPE